MSVALVTGALGQTGRYLCDLLVARGDRVVGAVRHPGRPAPAGVELVAWNMGDAEAMAATLTRHCPREVYNLAAFSSGAGMFDDPFAMGDVNGLAVTRLLEAIRIVDPTIRVVQASSSEIFGQPSTSPQDETTACHPRSPYGVAKLYAHEMVRLYRERHHVFACSAILYNHESPLRRREFVTRKITHAAASIRLGFTASVHLGDLAARRDWGFAGDTADAMIRMLAAAAPADYVVATGTLHSVLDVCEIAFAHVGLSWRDHVVEDAKNRRATEQVPLCGDARRARRELRWLPRVDFPTMIRAMVDADLAALGRDQND